MILNTESVPLFVISPAPGRRVRRPDGALLQPGETVNWSAYWDRRFNDRDVVMGDIGAVTSSKKKGE